MVGNTTADTFDEKYTEYQLNRSFLRKFIRKIYLQHAASLCSGKTIDFGCGVGEHLSFLESGSIGLEVNESTVKHCQSQNLPVSLYIPDEDKYNLLSLPSGTFNTILISHVLEHLDEPDKVLKALLDSGERLGVKRVVVIVPQEKGFASDITHRTFIDKEYLNSKNIFNYKSWRVLRSGTFPIPGLGKLFIYNEFFVVLSRELP